MIYFPKKAYSKIIRSIYFCKAAVSKFLANNSIILPIFSTIFTIDFSELDLRESKHDDIIFSFHDTSDLIREKVKNFKKAGETLVKRERECLKHKADVIITKQGVC